MAFCIPLGKGDSNCAEANALLFGLNWCIQNGYLRIIGETDSLLLQNCIQGTWQSPWKIEDTILAKSSFYWTLTIFILLTV